MLLTNLRFTKYLTAGLLYLPIAQSNAASFDFGEIPIHGDLSVFAVDHSNPQYNDALDSSFVETTLKIGTHLPLTERLSFNLRGAFGWVNGNSEDLTFVDNETETLFDLWNLEGENLFGGGFSFKIGRQEFEFGDGFLVWDGAYDEATVWTAEMRSMQGARVNWQNGPLTLSLFTAKTQKPFLVLDGFLGDHYGKSKLHGIHLAIDDTPLGHWEIAAFLRDDDSIVDADTLALSLRAEHTLTTLPSLTLAGEIVKESGTVNLLHGVPSASTQDRDAWAGHLDATWRFSSSPLEPYVKISRVLMSGDDPTTRDYEGYDPMFVGWADWGTWFVGSITSWEVFSTNERATLVELGFKPIPTVQLRMQLFDIDLDREWVPDAGRNWSREVNVIVDWMPPGPLIYGMATNYAKPRNAASAFVGDDEPRLELMAWVIWLF